LQQGMFERKACVHAWREKPHVYCCLRENVNGSWVE
jgi:hypothetical protein